MTRSSGRARPARLLRQHQHKALVNDIWLYVGELGRTTDQFRDAFMTLTQSYLAQVDRRVFAKLPSLQRLAYHLISAGRAAELLELVMWTAEQPVKTVSVVRERGRLRADLPFRHDPGLRLPARLYRPHWRELDPFVRVERVEWEDSTLVIEGLRVRPVGRHHQPPADLQVRRADPGPPLAAAGRAARALDPASLRHGLVPAGPVRLRLGGLPLRGQPSLVPARRPVADGGLAGLHPGPGPRHLASGPAAHAGGRPGRAARAAPGGAGHPVRRPLG